MVYAIIVYSMSVIVWGLKNYLNKINLPIWTKIVHVLISFLLFQYYFVNFRGMLWSLFRHGFESFHSQGEYYAFNKPVDFLITWLFFLISFFVAGLALNLAVKGKSRKLLLTSSPFIVIITTLDLYKLGIVNYNMVGEPKLFFVLFILVTVIFGVVNLFYNIKPGKNIFILSQQNLPAPNV